MSNPLATALSFLTVFRLPGASSQTLSSQDLATSFSFFPLVGLLLGASVAAVSYPFLSVAPPLLLATWIATLLTALTRGLHLDGLADLADGLGGGYTPERRLEIMKDSRIGAFGALALMLALLFKVSALYTLLMHQSWQPLLLVPALSRTGMVLAAYRSPYARSGGLGKLFLEGMRPRNLYTASALALTLGVLLAPFLFPIYAALTLMMVGLLRRLALKTLGGVTGDVLGATNELVEVLLFSAAACLAI